MTQYIDNVEEMRCKYKEDLNIFDCTFSSGEEKVNTIEEFSVDVDNITEFEEIENIWLVNFTQRDGLIFYFHEGTYYSDGSGRKPTSCTVWRTYNENTKQNEVVVGCREYYKGMRDYTLKTELE